MTKRSEKPKQWIPILYNSLSNPLNAKYIQDNPKLFPLWKKIAAAYIAQLVTPQNVNADTVNHNLEELLKPVAIDDPLSLKGNDVSYNILGQNVKFKIDTGAKISTLDATEIQWDRGNDAEKVNKAWDYNNDNFKDRSTLFLKHLADLPDEYKQLQFGSVKGFKLMLDKEGKESQDIRDEFEVVGVSWPKRSGGERDKEPRPVVKVAVEGNALITDLNLALVPRPTMLRRGLYGLFDMQENLQSIVMDADRDITIVPLKDVKPTQLSKALRA